MVLCACNADHTIVKLLDPPADALPGAQVSFPGYFGVPALPTHMAKKKILEKLAPKVYTICTILFGLYIPRCPCCIYSVIMNRVCV